MQCWNEKLLSEEILLKYFSVKLCAFLCVTLCNKKFSYTESTESSQRATEKLKHNYSSLIGQIRLKHVEVHYSIIPILQNTGFVKEIN